MNNSAREFMAQVRRFAEQLTGSHWNAESGTANAYAITPPIEPSSLVSGQVFRFKAANTNTGASNLKVGSLSTITVVKLSDTTLEAGDITAGLVYTVVYDGTYFQLQPSTKFVDDNSPITTRGDIIRGDSSGDPERLAIGSSGTLLKSDGTDASWGTITSSELPAGTVLQIANVQVNSVATGATVIPFDDTIPQNTEGNEFMSLAITPKSASSTLVIEVSFFGSITAAGAMTVALFQDSTADALAAVGSSALASNGVGVVTLTHKMTSGTTSETTFKVRAGSTNSGTTTINGVASSREYGGVAASSITITEIAE